MTNIFGLTEQAFHISLINEASRDIVFLMDIEQHGHWFGCANEELPSFMERAIVALLDNSVIFGWGEPGTSSWRLETEFNGANREIAKRIVARWLSQPRDYMALVFTRPEQ